MDLSVGDRLGRFEILGPLGAGGMGDVYRARHAAPGRSPYVAIYRGPFAACQIDATALVRT